jgi:hypothetical protein
MSLSIDNFTISRVEIIDDDPDARAGYAYTVEDMDLIPILADKPRYTNLDEFVNSVYGRSDAAICDYHLNIKNFASFYGSQTVAALYQKRMPAILCTRYGNAEVDSIRPFRRYIPSLLKPENLDPLSIEKGFRECIGELQGKFLASRRPWRTLTYVEERDIVKGYVYIIVPAWNPKEIVSLRLDTLPDKITQLMKEGKNYFHAQVNLGAEAYEDLYFSDWETE